MTERLAYASIIIPKDMAFEWLDALALWAHAHNHDMEARARDGLFKMTEELRKALSQE